MWILRLSQVLFSSAITVNSIIGTVPPSNSCILPEGWTIDTLMELYDSIPYNPDIANVCYRAGFIENWEQDIQKNCQPRVPKRQNEPLDEPKEELLTEKIIRLFRDNPKATYDDLAMELGVSHSTIEGVMGDLPICLQTSFRSMQEPVYVRYGISRSVEFIQKE